jgi:ornithine cyclodeaminase/alanine dehydrogenase-like protein (mu-crystallin family)
VLTSERIGELGATFNRRAPRREQERELIICDLTGVGVQDAAFAGLGGVAGSQPATLTV